MYEDSFERVPSQASGSGLSAEAHMRRPRNTGQSLSSSTMIHMYSPSQNMRWNHESPDYKGGYWTDGVTYTEEELTAADGLGGLGEDNRDRPHLAVPRNLALYECGYGHAVGTQILMDSPSEDYNTRLAWNPSPKGAMQGYNYYQRVSANDRALQYEHLGTTSISYAANPIQTTANTVNFQKAKSAQACNFCRRKPQATYLSAY
ncbi:hypothetical protein B0H13DRAFT_1887368 [Mycena leptocephala]|nr:hypothetical protein B0H13DRAFT_1887368 [Mycena leptocephala]